MQKLWRYFCVFGERKKGALDLSSPRIRRLVGSVGMDAAGRELFHRLWIERLGRPEALIHDTTSISTYVALVLAEFGHNRDGERLPQVNLCMVADRRTGLPLHYRVVPGSVPDVRTLTTTSDTLKALGQESFSYSLDRGFYNKSNVSKMLEEGLGFKIGVPLSTNIGRDALRRSASALRSLRSAFNFNGRETRFTRSEIDGEFFGSEESLALFVFRHPKRKAESENALVTRALALEEKAAAEGRMFMAFVAVALRIELERSARDAGLLCKFSVQEMLAEIEKIRIVRMNDGTAIPLETTKKQRTILERLGIPESLMS